MPIANGMWPGKQLVLRPVDGGDIDPFLDHLPKRAAKIKKRNQLTTPHYTMNVGPIPQFSQSLDGLDGLFDHVIYLLLSRKPPNPEANTGMGDIIGRAQCAEDIAWLQAGRGTRRA